MNKNRSTFTLLSPCFGVNVVPVHVIHQAVLVVAEGLVSPVHKHAAAGLVVHAAVAVTSLHHRASGCHNLPGVGPCKRRSLYWGNGSKALLEVRREQKEETVLRKLQVIEFKSSPLLQPFIRPICCLHINSGA